MTRTVVGVLMIVSGWWVYTHPEEVLERLSRGWYRLGAWWSPGPLRPQGNPVQRWWRLRCVGRRRQRRAMDAALRRWERQRFQTGHDVPHFNSCGGCDCECPVCVGEWDHRPSHPGFETWRRPCTCRECSQDCTKIGRLERSSNIPDGGPPPADYVTGHVVRGLPDRDEGEVPN